jgi:ABC-type antimicrobial peptide transport system permease subunit
MKATGWQAGDVMRLFVTEGVGLSLAGAALGIFMGWLAIQGLGRIPLDMALLAGTTLDLVAGPGAASATLPACH